jgi:hypothetical protein
MINYFCKKDYYSSKRDFESFVEAATTQGEFLEQVEFAKRYITEMDQSKK